MKTVNIAELKNHLSVYLNKVRDGEEIIVRNRNLPIARIVPFNRSTGDYDELTALAAQGKLRIGAGVIGPSFWKLSAPRVAPELLRTALEKERDED